MKKSIIFVCLGNICRSPLAYGIAKDYAKKLNLELFVDSAGTSSWHIGETPCLNSIKVAKLNQVDISQHRAKQIKKADFDRFDFVVALDKNNYKDLQKLSCTNLVKLGDYGNGGACIEDPYYFTDFEDFKRVYKTIEFCVKNLIDKEFRSLV